MINTRIENANLLVSNLTLTDSMKTTRLITDSPSASGTISVSGISGFAINNYILIGNFGDPTAEIVKLHAATAPTGTTITLATNTTRDHYADTPVTLINYNQVEFSRATTLTGAKVVLGSVQTINADRKESYYQDLTNSTGYFFVRFYNLILTTYSSYSTGVSYSGLGSTTVRDIVEKACADASVEIGGQYSGEKQLVQDANDCQDAITKYDWKFELVPDDSSITATQYENTYALTGLTYELKYPGNVQGLKGVKFGNARLKFIDNDEMDVIYADVSRTTVATQAGVAATSIVLTNTAEFASAGTVFINGMDIVYTANDTSTNTLSGIPAADITAIIAVGSIVWQNINPGLPDKYTITIDNKIVVNCPVDTEYNGYSFRMEYLKALTRFTEFASTTEVPFTDDMQTFIAAKIEKRKRNFENFGIFMKEFNDSIQGNLNSYKLPILEDTIYYNF